MIDIFNINGTLLKSVRIPDTGTFEISTNEFERGVYLIRLSLFSGELQTGKFIK
jgi:hypothetical protein